MARNELINRFRVKLIHIHELINARNDANGFTLIETLITISLVVVIMIAVVGILFSTLTVSSRKESTSSLRNEGNYALSQMELLIRNSVQVIQDPRDATAPLCTTNMSKITLRNLDEGVTTLQTSNGRIASLSGTSNVPIELTGSSATLTPPVFTCSQAGTNEPAYITVQFSLSELAAELGPQVNRTENFFTAAQIRSY